MPALIASRWKTVLAGGLIALAAVLAYGNSLSGAFVLDDEGSIQENPTIRQLWPIGPVLAAIPDKGLTVSGRPLVNLSLAVNYAIGGLDPWSYHVFNLIVHVLAGLVLFGVVRRTLAGGWGVGRTVPGAPGSIPLAASSVQYAWRTGDGAPYLGIAFAVALLWTLHPLQTESVTYIVQRAESMMGLFYLLTLYCFIRYVDADETLARSATDKSGSGSRQGFRVRPQIWAWLSVIACFLGMACKEVMVSAPVIVLLYDRTFVAGSFREAWRRRRGYYLGLAATWLALAALVLSTGNRGGTSGVGTGVGAWSYWLTQFPAVVRYLELSLWPDPLIFDYGTQWVHSVWGVVPAALVVIGLLVITCYCLFSRAVPLRPAARDIHLRQGYGGQIGGRLPGARGFGFLLFLFFAILAPTSLMPGVRQTMAEHRMYLALAPVTIIAVIALDRLLRRLLRERSPTGSAPTAKMFVAIVAIAAVGLGFATVSRNRDYATKLGLYRDTVAKLPDNEFAQNNLGILLVAAGRVPEAIGHYREGLRANPDSAQIHNDLGAALAQLGRFNEAEAQYEEALRLRPDYAEVYSNAGRLMFQAGHPAEAQAFFEHAIELKPSLPEPHVNLGNVLGSTGHLPEAAAQYEIALRLKPDYAEAHSNLANVLFQGGRLDEAMAHARRALQLAPAIAEAHLNLANILANGRRWPEAVAEYDRALQLRPDYADAHYDLAIVLRAMGRNAEAQAHLEQARKLRGR